MSFNCKIGCKINTPLVCNSEYAITTNKNWNPVIRTPICGREIIAVFISCLKEVNAAVVARIESKTQLNSFEVIKKEFEKFKIAPEDVNVYLLGGWSGSLESKRLFLRVLEKIKSLDFNVVTNSPLFPKRMAINNGFKFEEKQSTKKNFETIIEQTKAICAIFFDEKKEEESCVQKKLKITSLSNIDRVNIGKIFIGLYSNYSALIEMLSEKCEGLSIKKNVLNSELFEKILINAENLTLIMRDLGNELSTSKEIYNQIELKAHVSKLINENWELLKKKSIEEICNQIISNQKTNYVKKRK